MIFNKEVILESQLTDITLMYKIMNCLRALPVSYHPAVAQVPERE